MGGNNHDQEQATVLLEHHDRSESAAELGETLGGNDEEQGDSAAAIHVAQSASGQSFLRRRHAAPSTTDTDRRANSHGFLRRRRSSPDDADSSGSTWLVRAVLVTGILASCAFAAAKAWPAQLTWVGTTVTLIRGAPTASLLGDRHIPCCVNSVSRESEKCPAAPRTPRTPRASRRSSNGCWEAMTSEMSLPTQKLVQRPIFKRVDSGRNFS